MDYTVVEFAKSLKIRGCRIRNTPNLIFLCGGKIADRRRVHQSARDFFHRHLSKEHPSIAQRVKLAEEINAWFNPTEFSDLLELEIYLADLSDLTILFVESPGSIAELGAFSASNVLRPKTLAVINSVYGSGRSFISDGPIRKMREENPQLVHSYDWDRKHLNSRSTLSELQVMAQELATFLTLRDSSRERGHAFDSTKPGHVLLLVSDLIRISGVATSTEISECLSAIGHKTTREQVKRYLSLLEGLQFIKRKEESTQTFYVSTTSTPFIRYAYDSGAALKDPQRVMTAIRSALDPIRKRVLKREITRGTRHV